MVPEDVRDSYLVHLIKLLLEERLDEKEQIIVFSRTCKSVQVLGMLLQKIGARACVLHSILKQKQRFAALEQFKVFIHLSSDQLFKTLPETFINFRRILGVFRRKQFWGEIWFETRAVF